MKKILKRIWNWFFPVVGEIEKVAYCKVYIEVYKSKKNKKWYWRAKSEGNHEILCNTSQGYENLSDLTHTLSILRNNFECARMIIKQK